MRWIRFRAPGFSHPSVRAPLRGGLAFALADVDRAGNALRAAPIDGAACSRAVRRILLGSAIGMAASLVYDAAYAGGRLVDDYVGVKASRRASCWLPPAALARLVAGVYRRLLLEGAYRLTLLGFAQSFERIPSSAPPARALGRVCSGFAANFFLGCAEVAAPAVGLAFVVQVALGTLSRVDSAVRELHAILSARICSCAHRYRDRRPAGRGARAATDVLWEPALSESKGERTGEKTFEATPRRIARARREGNLARSSEIAAVLSFGAGGLAVTAIAPALGSAAAKADRASRVICARPRIPRRSAPRTRPAGCRFASGHNRECYSKRRSRLCSDRSENRTFKPHRGYEADSLARNDRPFVSRHLRFPMRDLGHAPILSECVSP